MLHCYFYYNTRGYSKSEWEQCCNLKTPISGVCGFGGVEGEILWYFVWLQPASQCVSATATLAGDFFDFYIQQTPTMKKTSKLERKSRGKYKPELFSKPISSNQDTWPATRWMNTVPFLFRHLSEGNYDGAHPSTFTAQKWITKKGN